MNKKSLPLIGSTLVLATALSGCIVAAPGEPVAEAPAGVVYVSPVGVVPGPGYSWRYYPHRGWGWWHPHEGWRGGWHNHR